MKVLKTVEFGKIVGHSDLHKYGINYEKGDLIEAAQFGMNSIIRSKPSTRGWGKFLK